MIRLILLLALGHIASAQTVDDILQRYFAAQKTNDERAKQYTYVEEDTHFTYDKAGVAKQESTETYDVIFVEGEEYKKLTSRKGQALSARDQAGEEKKPQDVAKERRKQRPQPNQNSNSTHKRPFSGAFWFDIFAYYCIIIAAPYDLPAPLNPTAKLN